ncbi:hypothetical protein [Hartmannibacter diazotrophicus]|uniref:hypothetical protein n=1 Tax=Hartmannibacter diazotrophicus TaxID=1482074 RepID=UPI0012FE065F|nr:hypothetical protein [Hartmannibacter diazotrophicus]
MLRPLLKLNRVGRLQCSRDKEIANELRMRFFAHPLGKTLIEKEVVAAAGLEPARA